MSDVPQLDLGFEPVQSNVEASSSSGLDAGFEPMPNSDNPQDVADFNAAKHSELQGKYGTVGQQAIAGAEGVAKGIAGPLATAGEKALGIPAEDIAGREQANPLTHGISEATGLIGGSAIPGVGEYTLGGKLASIEKGVSSLAGKGLASKIAMKTSGAAAANAAFQASDELSKVYTHPNETAQTAITNIGLSALLGGAVGGVFGAAHPLLEAGGKTGVGQHVSDFVGRLKEHLESPEPGVGMAEELNNYHAANERASQSSVPETIQESTAVPEEAALPNANQKIKYDPFEHKYGELYNPSEMPKRAGIDPFTKKPLPVADATEVIKPSEGLEATEVLKKEPSALDSGIKEANEKFEPFRKDFQKAFTSEINGQRVVDPDKMRSYLYQFDKGKGAIKTNMLQNYIDASSEYRKSLNDLHAEAGQPLPFQDTTPLNMSNSHLGVASPGVKAADWLVKNAASKLAGHVAGAIGLSHGLPGLIIGEYAGKKIANAVGAIGKPLLQKLVNANAFKHVSEYTDFALKGERDLGSAVGNVFKATREVLPESKMSNEKDRQKLNKSLDALKINPEPLLKVGGEVGYYLQDHGVAIGQMANTAVHYLNGLKPQPVQTSPLDTKQQPSKMQTMAFDRQLDFAQQPLQILQHVKEGTVQPQDVLTIKTIYPQLYNKIASSLTFEMINHTSDGSVVPYNTKLGLSMFLGEPLDSTMSPNSIMAAQPQSQMPPQGSNSPKKPSEATSKAMNKVADLSMTPGQARAAQKSNTNA